jgi:hypothetical protein
LSPISCEFCAFVPARPTTPRCSRFVGKLFDGGRLFAFTVLAAAIGQPGYAAKLTDKEHTRIEEPRPAGLPSDREMESAGAVIGAIDIDIRNIFDEGDARERNGLFRLANHLDRQGAAAVRQRRAVPGAQAGGDRAGAAPPDLRL